MKESKEWIANSKSLADGFSYSTNHKWWIGQQE